MAQQWPLTKRVEVEWMDSCATGGWKSVETHLKNSGLLICRTLGYLVEETEVHLLIAQSQSHDTKNVSDTIAIPRAMVRRFRRIPSAWKDT